MQLPAVVIFPLCNYINHNFSIARPLAFPLIETLAPFTFPGLDWGTPSQVGDPPSVRIGTPIGKDGVSPVRKDGGILLPIRKDGGFPIRKDGVPQSGRMGVPSPTHQEGWGPPIGKDGVSPSPPPCWEGWGYPTSRSGPRMGNTPIFESERIVRVFTASNFAISGRSMRYIYRSVCILTNASHLKLSMSVKL